MSIAGGPDIVENGLVLHLDAADNNSYPGSGTTWTDLTGNGNNGTLTNGPTFSSSNRGSIVFDGTNDYVNIAYSSSLAPTSQISFGSWVFLSSWTTTTFMKILSKTELGGYQIVINGATIGSGYVGALIYAGGDYRSVKTGTSTISSGYHNLNFTFDGRYFIIYLDGINLSTYDHGSNTTISYTYNNSLILGAEASTGSSAVGDYLNGRISNYYIYNRALSASEVLQNYNATKGRYGL